MNVLCIDFGNFWVPGLLTSIRGVQDPWSTTKYKGDIKVPGLLPSKGGGAWGLV